MSIKTQKETLFTTAEAAKYLGFAEDTIRRYVYRNLIEARKFGNSLVISQEECDRYKDNKRTAGRPPRNF